jgi:hypothetical protein
VLTPPPPPEVQKLTVPLVTATLVSRHPTPYHGTAVLHSTAFVMLRA